MPGAPTEINPSQQPGQLPDPAAAAPLGRRLRRLSRKCVRLLLRNLPLLVLLLPMQLSFAMTLKANPSRQLVYRHARLPLKHLSSHYLALHLSTRQRLQSVHHHYAVLNRHVRPDALAQLHDEGIRLWELDAGGAHHSIELGYPFSFDHPGRKDDHEGDLLLVFSVDDSPCFACSFTVMPLAVAHARPTGDSALFVGRVQGVGRDFERLRQTTRALGDVTPRDLLWQAVEGIGQALDIRHALGISNDGHVLRRVREGDDSAFDYDAYWESLGGIRTPQQMYLLPLPVPQKPLAAIAQKHRQRAARKRQFRHEVRQAVADSVRRSLLKAG